jgi:hypothetical protein
MTATDTRLVQGIFNSVAEIVLNEILRVTGLNLQTRIINLQKALANITPTPTS